MTPETDSDWQKANHAYLCAALNEIKSALVSLAVELGELLSTQGDRPDDHDASNLATMTAMAEMMDLPPSLEQLVNLFDLSRFERNIVLLCAGMELDSAFPSLCLTVQKDSQCPFPTFRLAMSLFPEDARWEAIVPAAALRYCQLIEVGEGDLLVLRPLKLQERVLHYLLGIQYLDERLVKLIKPMPIQTELVPSHQKLAAQIVQIWQKQTQLPVQLCGDSVDKGAIAAQVCASLGLSLWTLSSSNLTHHSGNLEEILTLWTRDALLGNYALLLDCEQMDPDNAVLMGLVQQCVAELQTPLFISSRDRLRLSIQSLISFDVQKPTAREQQQLWHQGLATVSHPVDGYVEALVGQFNLHRGAIEAVCLEICNQYLYQQNCRDGELFRALWDASRQQARLRLEDLAQRIDSTVDWDDLVLPEFQRHTLKEISTHVRQRSRVYHTWGFSTKSRRGLGISALFAGGSGTGKTLAAEVLAHELQLDLYRIDLSSIVSKYIGETEKNLKRVFDAAEIGGAILLFDEADALFGKRSEVKDSHDRYANMEVSYLLQRMETYQGLSILTTNLKDAIDTAFMRRIRFVIRFPFPDATQRAEIWRRVFPAATPTQGLEVEKLAQLNVAGGNIRNIAINAAFIAAEENQPVSMHHILQAAQSEYVKLERTITTAETKGWNA